MVISSPCLIDNKELTSPEQTATSKDFSNPLIVDITFAMQLTIKKPDVCVSYDSKQFWRSAEVSTAENGEVEITAPIDGHSISITEGSLRRHLKLDDQDGLSSISNSEIFEQLALMGYHTDSDKLTFQKGSFSPQWRFLIHNVLHCISLKKTAWEQFSSNIATALICLATNRKITSSPFTPNLNLPITPEHSHAAPPQPSPHNQSPHNQSPTQPSPTHQSPGAEHHFPTPHDSPLHAVHSHGSDEGSLQLNELMNLVTKLSDRIGALEDDLKKTKKTYSQGQEARGRTLSDAEVSRNAVLKLKLFIQEVTPTEKSVEKKSRQDKGKAKMIESEPKKKSKKELEQERGERTKDAMAEAKSLSRIDWNDPFSHKVWDFNQNIEPMDAEHGSEKQKSPEKVVEEEVDTQEELKEVVKEPGAKRNKSIPRKSTRKRQKMKEDDEKEELKGFLDIIPREEVPIEVESISTKFSIVDWKTCVLIETFMYYQVFRGDAVPRTTKFE
ncbi:hypothetical protein Tco_1367683 [Tanacetum coccineum]